MQNARVAPDPAQEQGMSTDRASDLSKHSKWYLFMEEPGSSKGAKRLADVMTLFVLGSIVAFCLETEHDLNQQLSYSGWTGIDWLFTSVFTVEFVIRLVIYIQEGEGKTFWKDPLNIIDLLAIIPSYIEFLQWGAGYNFDPKGPEEQVLLKLMKLLKCARVFKLMKHFNGTDVLVHSIQEALAALSIPFFFLAIFVLLFASVLYFIEQGEYDAESGQYLNGGSPTVYPNIPVTAYFILVTMTTVGYGDQYPNTVLGRILVAFCAIFGILFLAMPLTIVGNSFYNNWNKFLAKRDRKKREAEMKANQLRRRQSMGPEQLNLMQLQEQLFPPPEQVSKRLQGAQRELLTSYLNFSHYVGELGWSLFEVDQMVATPVEEKERNPDGYASKSAMLLRKLESTLECIRVQNAVMKGLISKSTNVKKSSSKLGLLKSASQRVLMQVKMRNWASVYGRGTDVAENAELAEKHQRGWRDSLYLLLEFPESSKAATIIARVSIIIISLSVIAFMLESVPELHTDDTIPEWGWFLMEAFFSFVFTVEFILRLIAAPRVWAFWRDGLNWCDLVAILPFYIELILAAAGGTAPWDFQVDSGALSTALRLVKLTRVLRVFKMTRQFPASRLVLETFFFSYEALLVPMFFLVVFVLIFSAMIFFLESGTWNESGIYVYDDGTPNPHTSIFSCFWLIIITITTVGYGDISPTTLLGRLVCVLAMIFGIIYTAMPLAIVGSYFFDSYDKQKKATSAEDYNQSLRIKLPSNMKPLVSAVMDGAPISGGESLSALIAGLVNDVNAMLGKPNSKPAGKLSLLNKLKNSKRDAGAESENKLDVVISGATAVDAEDPKEESESNVTPTILPLVVKRMRRRLTALQHLSAGIGRIVHYVVAVNHVEDGDE